ncbi:MAG TPA: glutamine amidotransferase [Flavobacteriia bacterium]|nr:glutamine amidotransferase [Flavobacteriia bacterium]
MIRISLFCTIAAFAVMSCTEKNNNKEVKKTTGRVTQTNSIMKKELNNDLPTIGILIFEGVIINEVIAPLDVFSGKNSEDKKLFNVILIAKENKTYTSANGLKVQPDYTIGEVPTLKVLVVPSSYEPKNQTSDKVLVDFIIKQNQTTDYMASHCAGAWLIGEAGIADHKEIVTYVTGGDYLKIDYPNLKVADDSNVSVVQDGKFISSNGSLVSYIASFDLLEKLTSKEHRQFVEASILFDRIKQQ